MTVKRDPIRTDLENDKRCTSRFAAMRCRLQSGHAGPHEHDAHRWGVRRRKR